MMTLVALVTYAAGWLLTAAALARMLAEAHNEPCSCRVPGRYGSTSCPNMVIHWRGDGTIGVGEMYAASMIALAWPILLLPGAAYLLADRKPTRLRMATRIAELERELGIGQDA